jgi:hemerythrin-like domain-containing protein
LTKQGLVLSIELNNIKNLNEKINYNKINDLLVDRDINAQKKRDIKKYETKLKALRELYINDIVKREKYLIDLVEHIEKEKNIFFDTIYKNNEKDESKDKDKDEIINNN